MTMGGVDELPPQTSVTISTILLAYKDQTASIDVSAAVSVQDVLETILSAFHLKASTRIIMKRAKDGAIAVPGPKLTPGEYTVEEIETPQQIAYRNLTEKHLPLAKKQLKEQHIPYIVNAGKTAGAHLTRASAIAGEHIQKGYSAAGEHVKNGYIATNTAVKNHVKYATGVANRHAGANSHTWTAKFWSSICTCAPGPVSFLTGVPVEELPIKKSPELTPAPAAAVVP